MEGGAKRTHTRDASFSSYISRPEGNFVTLSQKTEEGELSVFGAERYFNMMLEDDGRILEYDARKLGHSKKGGGNKGVHQQKDPKSRPGTPSTCSEASWNSQSALLQPSNRNLSQNKKKKVNGKTKLFSSFSCKGCSDKKSVYIHEINVRKLNTEASHNPAAKQSPPRFKGKTEEHLKETKEEPRKSLEVFGSNTLKGDFVAINLERRLSMLSWDAIPKPLSFSANSGGGPTINDDVESDASSDLFEIEGNL